jgi:hypothetical protein
MKIEPAMILVCWIYPIAAVRRIACVQMEKKLGNPERPALDGVASYARRSSGSIRLAR